MRMKTIHEGLDLQMVIKKEWSEVTALKILEDIAEPYSALDNELLSALDRLQLDDRRIRKN